MSHLPPGRPGATTTGLPSRVHGRYRPAAHQVRGDLHLEPPDRLFELLALGRVGHPLIRLQIA